MTEAERYDAAWATGHYQPFIGLAYVRCLYRTRFFDGYRTLLDVGCGNGISVRYHREIGNKEAFGIDFAKSALKSWQELDSSQWCSVASAENIPFKTNSFEMVTCTDMLEHIPEESVKGVLKEMLRVGNRDFFFVVALTPALYKMPHDGSEPHICLKHPQWWVGAMQRVGYKFDTEPHATIKDGEFKALIIQARKSVPASIIH